MMNPQAARTQNLERSQPFQRMKRMRAKVGREALFQFGELSDGNWHLLCARRDCRASIVMATDGVSGRTYTLSEMLSTAVAHHVDKHALDLTYESYGEDYA